MQTKIVFMPRELTAENGAKALMSGEFYEHTVVSCEECADCGLDEMCFLCDGSGFHVVSTAISWDNIKAIYAKAVEHFGE